MRFSVPFQTPNTSKSNAPIDIIHSTIFMNGVIAAGAVLCRFSIYPASIPVSNEMIYPNIEQTKANRHSMTMHMKKHIYTHFACTQSSPWRWICSSCTFKRLMCYLFNDYNKIGIHFMRKSH